MTCFSYMLQKSLNHSKLCLCLGCSLRTCPWVLGTGLRCGTGTLRMGPCLGGTVGRPSPRSSSPQVTNCLSGSCQTRRILGEVSTSRTKQVKFTCIHAGHRIFFNTGNHFWRLIWESPLKLKLAIFIKSHNKARMYQFGTILMFQTFYEEGLVINILAIVNLLQNCYVYKNFH